MLTAPLAPMDPFTALLDTMPTDRRLVVLESVRLVEADVGTALMRQGEADPSMVYLRSGGVSIHSGELSLCDFGPGEVAGAEQVVAGPPRLFEVRAAAPTELVVVRRAGLLRLREAAPSMARVLDLAALGSLARCLAAIDRKIVEQARMLLTEREPDATRALPFLAEPPWTGPPAGPVGELACDLARRLDELVTEVRYCSGQDIPAEGAPGGAVHLVLAGQVDKVARVVEGLVVRLSSLGPDAVFGVGTVEEGSPHTFVAVGVVRTLRIDADVWHTLIALDDPDSARLRDAALRSLATALPRARALVEAARRCMRVAIHDRLYHAPQCGPSRWARSAI